MIDFYRENKKIDLPTFEELYELKGEDWNGNSWKKQGDEWVEFSTYNPNSKWDWYSVGGRWTGFFKLKPGATGEVGDPGLMTDEAPEGFADIVRKKDIDIDFMKNEKEKSASEAYDKAMEILKDLPVHRSFEELYEENPETARDVYHSQPRLIAWKNDRNVNDYFGFFTSPDDFLVTKEQYVNTKKNSTIVPYAFVKDGVWYEKGKMGWFGMSDDKMTQDEWNEQFHTMFNELPDDTLLTLVDCHI